MKHLPSLEIISHGLHKNKKEILLIFLCSLVMVNWMKGYFYVLWDITLPPFNPEVSIPKLFSIWDYSLVGGRNFIYLAHLPYHVIIYLLSFILPLNIANTVLFWLLFLITGLSMYFFVLETVGLDEKSRKFAAVASAMFYMFNPYWIFRIPTYLSIIWIIAFLPLLMLVVRKAFIAAKTSIAKTVRYAFLASLITLVMTPGLAVIPAALATGIFVLTYLFFLSISRGQLKSFVITLLPLSIFSFLIQLWWIGPQMMNFFIQTILNREQGYVSTSLHSLAVQTKYMTWSNLLRGMAYFTPSFEQTQKSFSAVWSAGMSAYNTPFFVLISFLTPLIIFTIFLSKRTLKASEALVFALVTLALMPFFSALNPPFGILNAWLMNNFPLFVFRRPDSYMFLLEFSYAYMFGLGLVVLYDFLRRQRGIISTKMVSKGVVFSLLVLIISTNAFPFILGHEVKINMGTWNYLSSPYLSENIQPVSTRVKVPGYVEDVIDYLNEDPTPGGVLLLPWSGTLRAYNWSHGYYGLDVYYLSLNRPTLSNVYSNYPIYTYYLYIDYAIETNKSGFANLLRFSGIKYIIVAEDALLNPSALIQPKSNLTEITKYLAEQEDIILVKRFDKHLLYRINKLSSPTYYAVTKTFTPKSPQVEFTLEKYISSFHDLEAAWGGSNYVTKNLEGTTLELTYNYSTELKEKEYFVPSMFNKEPLKIDGTLIELTLRTEPNVGVHFGVGKPGELKLYEPVNPNMESEGNLLISTSDYYTFKFDVSHTTFSDQWDYFSIQLPVLTPQSIGNYTVSIKNFSIFFTGENVAQMLSSREEDVVSLRKDISIPNLNSSSIPPVVEITEIGPTNARLHMINVSEPFILVSTNTYDDSWVALVDGHQLEHIPVNFMFNGWIVEKTGNYNIEILFIEQKYVNIFFLISSLFIILTSFYIISNYWGEKKRRVCNGFK